MKQKDVKFLETVCKELVTEPKEVKVNRISDELGVLLEVSANVKDVGILIGRQGKTANALRVLLRIIGAKQKSRINLKIINPNETTNETTREI